MNARNLPGFGDAETFGPAAVASLQLIDEMYRDDQPSDDDTPSIGDRREACAVIRDWLTEAESALMRGDLKRHFECLQEGLDVLSRLRGLEQ